MTENTNKTDELSEDKISEDKISEGKKPKKPRTVRMTLFKDNGKYKDDVFVAVNGKTLRIKRGVPVDVPIEYVEVLEASFAQDAQTAALIESESGTLKNYSA